MNLVAPKKPGELSYKEICEQLEKHFSLKPIKIAERFRFYSRQQQSKETGRIFGRTEKASDKL